MTKKQEALNKAKESGKKAIEGGKEFGKGSIQVIGGTTGALGYTLLSGSEKIASKISESKKNSEGISSEEMKKHIDKAAEYNKRAKKHIVTAGNFGKKTISGTWKATKGGVKALGYGAKTGYHLIDAGDKAIGEKIEKKQIEKGKKSGKISNFFRDNIIKLLIATGAAGYGGYEGGKYIMDKNQDGKEIIINNESEGNSNETLLIPTGEYNRLNGKTFYPEAELTRQYLGCDLKYTGNYVIGDTLTLNPAKSLHNLWTKKIQKYGQFTNDISKLDSMDVSSMTPEEIENFRFRYPIDATYLFVVKPYVDGKEVKDTMSLQQFIDQTNQIVKELKSDTESYEGGLTGVKKDLFDAIRKDINGKTIVAYAMTELCENKKNGETNKELFDLLLKNAGVNFLSNVPAIYDGKTSYGLYQFTEYALYDRGGKQRGASVVNKVLPKEKKISGSVIDLRTWKDQTKAAYMFALCNINTAIKKLTDDQAKDLLVYQKSNREKFRDNMTQLIAMCHHRPADAKALKDRHKSGYKNDIFTYGDPNHGMPYGEASKVNYESLKK